MTEQQNNMIAPILETIVDEEIRTFAYVLVNDLPDYIWRVPASSTGKYHPAYSLGDGGLMRHQMAVVRFMNFFFSLEQFQNEFTAREMDLMRVAGLVHDGRKSGEQSEYERSKFTKFEHPIKMANAIRKFDGEYLNHDDIEFIANCIESHMGQWTTDKKSSFALPKPVNKYQQIVHLADYLASRKDLTMAFDNVETPAPKPVDINEYVVSFGKYKGTKLVDLYRQDRSYCMWLKENSYQKEIVELIKQIEKQQTSLEDDEI